MLIFLSCVDHRFFAWRPITDWTTLPVVDSLVFIHIPMNRRSLWWRLTLESKVRNSFRLWTCVKMIMLMQTQTTCAVVLERGEGVRENKLRWWLSCVCSWCLLCRQRYLRCWDCVRSEMVAYYILYSGNIHNTFSVFRLFIQIFIKWITIIVFDSFFLTYYLKNNFVLPLSQNVYWQSTETDRPFSQGRACGTKQMIFARCWALLIDSCIQSVQLLAKEVQSSNRF